MSHWQSHLKGNANHFVSVARIVRQQSELKLQRSDSRQVTFQDEQVQSPVWPASTQSKTDGGKIEQVRSTQAAVSLDGIWDRGTINGFELTWDVGGVNRLLNRTDTTLEMIMHDELYTAELKADGRLHWSDGDIWTKETIKPQQDEKPKTAQRETQEAKTHSTPNNSHDERDELKHRLQQSDDALRKVSSQLEDAHKALQQLRSKCTQLEARLKNEVHQDQVKYQASLEQLQSDNEWLSNKMRRSQARLQELQTENALLAAQTRQSGVDHLQDQLDKVVSALSQCKSQNKDLQSQLVYSEARTLQFQDELERLRDELENVRQSQEQTRSNQDEMSNESAPEASKGRLSHITWQGALVADDGYKRGPLEIIKWFSADSYVRVNIDDLGEIRMHL